MFMTTVSNEQSLPFRRLAMHSLAAASRLRLSETGAEVVYVRNVLLCVLWANPSLS